MEDRGEPDPDLVDRFSRACEGLYRRMHRNRSRATARRNDPSELSDTEFAMLTPLTTGARRTVGQLAREVGISSPTLSRALARLEDSGLVARHRIGPAGHQVEVTLTDPGRSAWHAARARTTDRQRRALARLAHDRREAVVTALDELSAAIDAADAADAADEPSGR